MVTHPGLQDACPPLAEEPTCDPVGIRTPVSGMRTQYPSPLDDRAAINFQLPKNSTCILSQIRLNLNVCYDKLMAQIKRIGVKQTAKVVAIFYFAITLPIFIPLFVISLLIGGFTNSGNFGMFGAIFGGIFMLVLPFLYAILGGVMVAISAATYNFIAKRFGGIEVEIENETATKDVITPNTPDPTKPVLNKTPWR